MRQLMLIILAVCFISQNYFPRTFLVGDNVIFDKTNEVLITRAKRLLSIVIDFDDFKHFMSLIYEDIKHAEAVISIALPNRKMEDFEAFKNSFLGLQQEIDFLQKLKDSIKTEMEQIMQMHKFHTSRTERPLIPFIGKDLSWLFGVVTDADLIQIRHQVSVLTRNQKQVIYVEQALSIINESRVFVKENRRSIISITKSI